MTDRRITRRTVIRGGTAAAIAGAALASRADAQPAVPLHGPGRRRCLSFQSGGQTCFGMVHVPSGAFGKRPAVLIMHGLVGSKDQPHRIFVTLAEALAKAGFASLRFDLRGRGDSEGESIDITPKRDLEDARNALETLRQQPEVDADNVTLLGLSWGGNLAAMLSGSTGVKRVVLWSSVPTDNESWPAKLKDVNGRQAADLYGNLIGKEFYDGLAEMTPFSELKRARRPVLMVWGTGDEAIRRGKFEALASDLEFADVRVRGASVEGADHAFMSHEHERKAIEATLDWLKST